MSTKEKLIRVPHVVDFIRAETVKKLSVNRQLNMLYYILTNANGYIATPY